MARLGAAECEGRVGRARGAEGGLAFGQAQTAQFIRFSTASSMAHLQEAVTRLRLMIG